MILSDKFMSIRLVLCFALVAIGLAACGSDDGDKPETEIAKQVKQEQENPGAAADKLYKEATEALEADKYEEAARLYEELERQYPYFHLAAQSQLMAAFAIYSIPDYNRAIMALDRFIELHPGHEDVDYAHYLKALSHYEQISGVKLDQSRTRAALEGLNKVIRRFPNSEYARDARFKRDLTLNHLAGKEMEVGRFYLRRKQVHAAINRFKNVVENYQTTTHVPEALHRLVESYRMLGLEEEAKRVAAVLGYNYPGSKWYEYSYRLFDEGELKRLTKNKSWMASTLESLFPNNSEENEENKEAAQADEMEKGSTNAEDSLDP